jgi:hypothetical protein
VIRNTCFRNMKIYGQCQISSVISNAKDTQKEYVLTTNMWSISEWNFSLKRFLALINKYTASYTFCTHKITCMPICKYFSKMLWSKQRLKWFSSCIMCMEVQMDWVNLYALYWTKNSARGAWMNHKLYMFVSWCCYMQVLVCTLLWDSLYFPSSCLTFA